MEHIKWLIEIFLGAAALVGAGWVVAKPIRSAVKAIKAYTDKVETWQKATDARLDTLDRHQHETWLETLRHKIFSSSLPLCERVNAGETYVSNGGNGTAKVQHDKNVQLLREKGEP